MLNSKEKVISKKENQRKTKKSNFNCTENIARITCRKTCDHY